MNEQPFHIEYDGINRMNRIGYLDGIRGLAILLVGTGHFFYDYPFFKITWTGLNLFFMLSGYLITQRLYAHYQSPVASYFRNFYVRRILRIFPLYYGCLVVFFLLLPLFYSSFLTNFGEIYSVQGWYWGYASNWLFVTDGIPHQQVFFHFWSLAVEEQFYLIWPVLFLLVVRVKGSYYFLLLLIAGSIFLRNYAGVNYASYLNTGTAAEPLLVGALVTLLEKNKKLEALSGYFYALAFGAIAALFWIFLVDPDPEIVTNKGLYRVGYSAVDFLWAFLFVVSTLNHRLSKLFRRILNMSWLTWLGKYSYGIYVFHWIALALFVYKGQQMMQDSGMDKQAAYFLSRAAGLVGVLLVSYLSYHLYEKQFLRLKKYFI